VSIKPFSKKVDAQKVDAQVKMQPFVDDAKGGKELDAQSVEMAIEVQESFVKRGIKFLGSLWGFLSVSAFFIFVVVVVDALKTVEELYLSNSILDSIYFFALVFLAFTMFLGAYRYYAQLKNIKSVTKTREFYTKQKDAPTKEILKTTIKLLKNYEHSQNEALRVQAKLLRSDMASSRDYTQIYKDLDERVLSVVDAEVKSRIKTASTQAAISTAISPLALLDSAIIIWRSFLLTKEIASLYGYRTGFISSAILLKQGAFNVFFAGVAELGSEYINTATEAGVVSKVSFSVGQGVANGILLARLGYGVMNACRPLPSKMKRESFLKGIYATIKKVVS
jgi:putative membrane protein